MRFFALRINDLQLCQIKVFAKYAILSKYPVVSETHYTMKHTASDITRIEEVNEETIRLHFNDGSTIRMSRKAYESGTWQKGTSKGLIVTII